MSTETFDCADSSSVREASPPRRKPSRAVAWSSCRPTRSTASALTPSTAPRWGVAGGQGAWPRHAGGRAGGFLAHDRGLVYAMPDGARDLIRAFWPGALSLVVVQAPSLQWDLGNAHGTVMLRMPLHPVAIELLREVGPMAVSSANVSGQPPAVDADEARRQLAIASRSTSTRDRPRSRPHPPSSTSPEPPSHPARGSRPGRPDRGRPRRGPRELERLNASSGWCSTVSWCPAT